MARARHINAAIRVWLRGGKLTTAQNKSLPWHRYSMGSTGMSGAYINEVEEWRGDNLVRTYFGRWICIKHRKVECACSDWRQLDSELAFNIEIRSGSICIYRHNGMNCWSTTTFNSEVEVEQK